MYLTGIVTYRSFNQVLKPATHPEVGGGLSLVISTRPQCCSDPTNLKLAQKHYQVRVLELRDLVAEEEVKFK